MTTLAIDTPARPDLTLSPRALESTLRAIEPGVVLAPPWLLQNAAGSAETADTSGYAESTQTPVAAFQATGWMPSAGALNTLFAFAPAPPTPTLPHKGGGRNAASIIGASAG